MRAKKAKKPVEQESLYRQLQSDRIVLGGKTRGPKQSRQGRVDDDDMTGDAPSTLDSRTAQRIVSTAKELEREVHEEEHAAEGPMDMSTLIAHIGELDAMDDDDEASESMSYTQDDVEPIDENDERAFHALFPKVSGAPQERTLADIILAKIAESESTVPKSMEELDEVVEKRAVDPKVVEVYKQVGVFLSRYRSGKIPKALKIVPKLSAWDEVVWLMKPYDWSPQAVYVTTKLFSAGLNARMAQRFYALVLLPHIRGDLRENKKLNFHLYAALMKAMFKPAAFYKGIVLPLCESPDVTLREANIIASVLAKKSIPMLDSAATMLKLATMEFSGSVTIVLRVLIDKKYALPRRVVDALVNHFMLFKDFRMPDIPGVPKELPVLWHRCLLSFVARYKGELSVEQKEGLLSLVRIHSHYAITPEIRRELAYVQESKHGKDREREIKERQRIERMQG